MDALQSFTFLADNVPQWLTKLDDLLAKCEVQYERFSCVVQHTEVKLLRKKKHDSTESLRPDREFEPSNLSAMNIDSPPAPEKQDEPILSQTTTNDTPKIARDARRKRRAGSEPSGAPSNHCRYRSKNMVIVYYDSEIQDMFEALVKSIATARNNLRKGKNAATIKLRMASMGMDSTSTFDGNHDRMEGVLLDPKTLMTPALARAKLGRQSAGGSGMKGFEDADKDLEEAQNFCERGAHQFLRDGDCNSEIEGTRKRFISCKNVATREVEKLEKEAEAKKVLELKQAEKDEMSLSTSEFKDEKSIEISPDLTGPPPLKQVDFAGIGTIEIDDGSDEESIQIDMSAIRRTVRTTRT